ncbi:dUTP diphosphatase [Solibacillus sp. FSL K6-1523]|uniref:dUTP diphosphatase n=1 Tax=Solibacillus sp. FSL K6-1523 TaxID=2921471 RepID=UPI0030F782C0
MNLEKLFETQAQLDGHIYTKHPELRGQDNLDWKLLALQVELAECANEWRGFKKWSTDQEPRTFEKVECATCQGTGDENYEMVQEAAEGNGSHEYIQCEECKGTGYDGERNPLLEEYVDCLHFALSIGIELQIYNFNFISINSQQPTMDLFMEVMAFTTELYWHHRNDGMIKEKESTYKSVLYHLLDLGQTLGFEWEQVEAAYYAKNKVNHERQESGY